MNGVLLEILAQAPPGSERGEEFGKTSPIALVVILLLLVATVLLIRSMGKHLRKVPASFEETGTEAGAGGDDGEGTEDDGGDGTGADAGTRAGGPDGEAEGATRHTS